MSSVTGASDPNIAGIQSQVNALQRVAVSQAQVLAQETTPDLNDLQRRVEDLQATGGAFRHTRKVDTRSCQDALKSTKKISTIILGVFASIAVIALTAVLVSNFVPTAKALLVANKLIVPMNATLGTVASVSVVVVGIVVAGPMLYGAN